MLKWKIKTINIEITVLKPCKIYIYASAETASQLMVAGCHSNFQPVTSEEMKMCLCGCHIHLDPILPARDTETEEPLKHLSQSDTPALTFSVKFHLPLPSNTDPQATSTTPACY